MDVDDLLARAWKSVEASGIPEPLQAVALQEAIAFLTRDAVGPDLPDRKGERPKDRTIARDKTRTTSSPARGDGEFDADDFWARLAHESGVEEARIRDILQLSADRTVLVTQPTRALGKSVAEQARSVIVLVASARAIGLDEQPANADAVRVELERKRCYQANNFAAKHLGPLKGFNAGANRTQIVLTSKWIEEFAAVVKAVHGDNDAE
jgi:hypothetical protein